MRHERAVAQPNGDGGNGRSTVSRADLPKKHPVRSIPRGSYRRGTTDVAGDPARKQEATIEHDDACTVCRAHIPLAGRVEYRKVGLGGFADSGVPPLLHKPATRRHYLVGAPDAEVAGKPVRVGCEGVGQRDNAVPVCKYHGEREAWLFPTHRDLSQRDDAPALVLNRELLDCQRHVSPPD